MGRYSALGLRVEADRLSKIGGTLLGICGDRNHSFGFHLPANELPVTDYSRSGRINRPDDPDACCAIDIGMDWKSSREWLRWLIAEKRAGRLDGVLEVIGSYDGKNVRYWSWRNTPNWPEMGEFYSGEGHDRWTHVGIARSMSKKDHGILKGWTATGYEGDDLKFTDTFKIGKWILDRWPGTGQDDKLSVQTAFSSTYGHARAANEQTELILKQQAQIIAEQADARARDEAIMAKLDALTLPR